MSPAEPSRLTADLIRRWRAIEPEAPVRVRRPSRLHGDLRFFALAYLAGFLFFLILFA